MMAERIGCQNGASEEIKIYAGNLVRNFISLLDLQHGGQETDHLRRKYPNLRSDSPSSLAYELGRRDNKRHYKPLSL